MDLTPAACWMLFRYRENPTSRFGDLQAIRDIPLEVLEHGRAQLLQQGYAQDGPSGTTGVTAQGVAVSEQLRSLARTRLVAMLEGWSPEQYPDLQKLLSRLADDIAEAPPDRAGKGRTAEPVA